MRRGKVGGFVDYLDEATQEYIRQVVHEMGTDECNWYFAAKNSTPLEQ